MSDPKTKDEILAERAIIAKLVHAAFCPNCEAAARERDAAYEDARQMQARLQRLIDADDHICERCGEVIPFEHPCNCQKCWNEQVGMHADLRARLSACAAAVRAHEERIQGLLDGSEAGRLEAYCEQLRQACHQRLAETVEQKQLADDLRARLAARLASCEADADFGMVIRCADEAAWLRDLLREEAK